MSEAKSEPFTWRCECLCSSLSNLRLIQLVGHKRTQVLYKTYVCEKFVFDSQSEFSVITRSAYESFSNKLTTDTRGQIPCLLDQFLRDEVIDMTLPRGHMSIYPDYVQGPQMVQTIILFVTFCKPLNEFKTLPFKFIVNDDPNAVNSITVPNKRMQRILSSYVRLASIETDIPPGPGSGNFVTDPPRMSVQAALEDALDAHDTLHREKGTSFPMFARQPRIHSL